ncbi:uncharacterized protein PRCAT00004643001 [Priceomyces carsonii]|uniref:uncharacterized protein n=1 Tax=Priceomyces carsonii TaxID=28549 RepID=UPI002ED9C821|nr:unnamed protein product [Priceomyces carsonii]
MAENELALINKVELRIALAADDKQLEKSLHLYLAPIINKLSSPHASVRNAVLKVLENLSPRIAAAREIKLPVEALLNQVKDPKAIDDSSVSTMKIYSLIFMARGIERMSDDEKITLIPEIIEHISNYPSKISARMFGILCNLLKYWKDSDRGAQDCRDFLRFDLNVDDEAFLSNCIAKFLLLQSTVFNSEGAQPGLSADDVAFYTKDSGVTFASFQDITHIKLRLFAFLKTAFKDEFSVLPILIASTDGSSTLKDSSEIWFRKLKLDLEDPKLISRLIDLYVGVNGIPPVKSTLQEKILIFLCKSKLATRNPMLSQITDIGLSSDYSKLRQTSVHFIKWVNQNNNNNNFGDVSKKMLDKFNRDVIMRLKESIMSEGWPRMDRSIMNRQNLASQRQLKYEAIGNVLRSNPDLFVDDFSYLQFLFDALESEESDFKGTIQDVLSSLVAHLPKMTKNSKSLLKVLGRNYLSGNREEMNHNIQSCRYVILKYINAAFPFHDPEARYLCILGTFNGNTSDTIEEAKRGLHPYWFNIFQSSNSLDFKPTSDLLGQNSSVKFPQFKEIVRILYDQLIAIQSKDETILKVLGEAINFTLQTLVMHAVSKKKTVIVSDMDWSIRLERAIEVDDAVRELLVDEIKLVFSEGISADEMNKNCYITYLLIILDALVGQYDNSKGIALNITYGSIFLRLISLSPSAAVGNLCSKLDNLLACLSEKISNDLSLSQISQAIGIIGSHPDNPDDEVRRVLDSLLVERSRSSTLKHSFLPAAYLISRLAFRGRHRILEQKHLEQYCGRLLQCLSDNSTFVLALECVSELSIFGVLGPRIDPSFNEFVCQFADSISTKVKKCDERSVLTLSYLTLALTNENKEAKFEKYLKLIYDTHVSKQVEFTFSSGEALLVIAAGWDSTFMKRKIDILYENNELIPKDTSKLSTVLDMVLESCRNTKPSLRKAACIWLLSLVQYCGHLEPVKKVAPQIHVTFMKFLAHSDDLVQESASRGLSLVYEMGDSDLKDTLVHSLLTSFTNSNTLNSLLAGSVDRDTELFEPDLLKTNDGSVSTYKDVLNLASDVGDPSLVYKFMSLAKSSALWSSRKGMAFGLGTILSKTSLDDLLASKKHLSERLIPRLYRYRFDPNTSVSQSMNDIWNSIIKDTSKTVNDNFLIILNELLRGIGNREWRVRQASTSALADLLQIVSLEDQEFDLQHIWNMCFRAMDDIKESVRKEGNKLAKVLATNFIRIVDVKDGKQSSKEKSINLLKTLLPFLLGTNGLQSDSEDVRSFALDTILKLCKVNNQVVKPVVPELLENFISLMSSLEPEIVNYLVLNADKYKMKENDIDAKRLQSLGASPLMDAIDKLLDLVDETNIAALMSSLQAAIKKSVGLPSKACGSRVIVSLVSKRPTLITPYGDMLLKLCVLQLKDRNETISSSYGLAIGFVCRLASLKSISELSSKIDDFYFKSEDARGREISALVSESISKHSGERFASVASSFLPLSFIGKNDSNMLVKSCFEREWNENTSGSDSSVRLYLNEIIVFYEKYLSSNKFDIRQTLGKSISNLCDLITDFDLISESNAKELMELLIVSCKGKSWVGKELILESLVSFSKKSKRLLRNNMGLLEKINNTVVIEANRKNKRYQKRAAKILGNFINTYSIPDLIDAYVKIMDHLVSDQYLDDDSDDDDMVIDSHYDLNPKLLVRLEEERLDYLNNMVESFPVYEKEGAKVYSGGLLALILHKTLEIFNSSRIEVTWRSKITVCDDLVQLISKMNEVSTVSRDEAYVLLVYKNWECLSNHCSMPSDIENVKISFIRLSHEVILLLEDTHHLSQSEVIKGKLCSLKQQNVSNVVQTEIKNVLQKFN